MHLVPHMLSKSHVKSNIIWHEHAFIKYEKDISFKFQNHQWKGIPSKSNS
jgi:hypothetical protein